MFDYDTYLRVLLTILLLGSLLSPTVVCVRYEVLLQKMKSIIRKGKMRLHLLLLSPYIKS
jgi:hypothetical protein